MGILVGFAVGYFLGARGGRERLEELQEAWRVIAASPDFQLLLGQALGLLSAATPLMTRLVVEQGGELTKLLGNVNLGDLTGERVKQIVTEMMSQQKAAA